MSHLCTRHEAHQPQTYPKRRASFLDWLIPFKLYVFLRVNLWNPGDGASLSWQVESHGHYQVCGMGSPSEKAIALSEGENTLYANMGMFTAIDTGTGGCLVWSLLKCHKQLFFGWVWQWSDLKDLSFCMYQKQDFYSFKLDSDVEIFHPLSIFGLSLPTFSLSLLLFPLIIYNAFF